MKPDWNDAPEWAEWLAMDDDGSWWWHEEEPLLYDGSWNQNGEIAMAKLYPTKEQRPS